MTAAQEEALTRIENIMREHFAAGLCTVVGEVPGCDNKEDIRSVWHGGCPAALGLADISKQNVHRSSMHR